MTKTVIPSCEELEKAGFATAAQKVETQKSVASQRLRSQLRTAFEHFRVVTPENVDAFNERLKEKTKKRVSDGYVGYYQLRFTPIRQYQAVPPLQVLTALEEAKKLGCFDSYEIADLAWVNVYDPSIRARMEALLRDPVLFGRITESDNYYFIAQWDNDVRIEDILREDEG